MANFGSKRKNILLGAFFIFIGMLVYSVIFLVFSENNISIKASTITDNKDVQNAISVQNAFRLVAKTIKPSVVNISSETVIRTAHKFPKNDPFFDFFGRDFFDFFFDIPKEYKQKSLGTGVIIDEDGYLLSNYHVVKNATKIIVTLSDGRKFKAKIIGTDPKTDIAVLKIDAKNLPAAPLGDSDEVEVGDWAIAIGNPFGLSQTVTVGIISAKGRDKVGIEDYEDFLQTDASINPGNSGGPLVNIKGEVIGINTAIASPNGGSVGIGFAIPINMAKAIIPQLKTKGKVVRGWLGVYIQDLTEEIAKPLKLEPHSGVLVSDVTKNSPAEKAGIEVGDVIVEFDNTKITDVNQIRKLVALSEVGKTYKIKVKRNGKTKTLSVKIQEMPSDEEVTMSEEAINEKWLGMQVSPLTAEIKRQFHIAKEQKQGVVIVSIDNGSVAQESGLQIGDIILRINNRKIESIKDYSDIAKEYKDGGSLLFLIKRQGHTIFIGVDSE